jgi:uncharacterized protein
MISRQFVRQFAAGQQIDEEVADQEVVLHYALALLNEAGLVGRPPAGGQPGPLLFKGGTALRKCVFGSTGRFSQDIDLSATVAGASEADTERAFLSRSPYHGIEFRIPNFRYSGEENFSGTVEYTHESGSGAFELQISYRLDSILDSVDLHLAEQPYFRHLECGVPVLHGLDPYEMIGEKIVACNRRLGGSGKDVYDLFLWSDRPFDETLVRRLAMLKAWIDRRVEPRYEPERLLATLEPKSFQWTDLAGLVPRKLIQDPELICRRVRQRFDFLAVCSDEERALLEDQTAHRQHTLFEKLKEEARNLAAMARR